MNMLFLTILFPLLGYVLLSFSRGRLSENVSAMIGVGSMGLSALTSASVIYTFMQGDQSPYVQVLWTWLSVDGFAPRIALHLDGLSLTMLGVVTGVGFFIHLFASWYMRGEEGYSRFFSYMNLFVASMLFLVLGDNLMLLYLGWEGVGLCSYLLIGFYYKVSANGAAAMKAFITTRVGDVFMAIGLFILYRELGTLDIAQVLVLAPQKFQTGDTLITLATLCLLGGAVGKSAQLPLQTWLADAMAGPTPVSALIHAATMVTAGVYLIARTHGLFLLAPNVLELVGTVGALTLLMAGFAALVQTDIKRVLAYSTMSQIGYMFLALGAGAWHAAIFHLMTHAFFKALLFLSSGAVILACHHEQNIFRMGGLYKKLPLVYACFLIGGSALAALPFFTAGFYSKDDILWGELITNHPGFLYAGLVGAFMTSLYTFRLIMIVFHGEAKTDAHAGHGIAYALPLSVLLVLSTFVGALIQLPLAGVLPELPALEDAESLKHQLEILSGCIAVAGVLLSILLYMGDRRFVSWLSNTLPGKYLGQWWYNAWGFDWLYNLLFIRPFVSLAAINKNDGLDKTIGVLPWLASKGHDLMVRTENGRVRWYAAGMMIGLVAILGVYAL